MKKIFKILFIFICFFIIYKVNATELNSTTLDIASESMTCADILGPNLIKILKLFIAVIRIAGAIIAIITGMLSYIPAIVSDDASALKKANKKLIMILIILVVIGLFPTLIRVIGRIAGFDLSCL